MLDIEFTRKMKRDVKRMRKRGYDMSKLDAILRLLSSQEPMPPGHLDHKLSGDLSGFRECHIESDWLLIYKILENRLTLSATGTGTDSDLFEK